MKSNLAERAENICQRIASAELQYLPDEILQNAAEAIGRISEGKAEKEGDRAAFKEAAQAIGKNYRELDALCSADKETIKLVRQEMGINAYVFLIHDQNHISDQLFRKARDLHSLADGISATTAAMDYPLFQQQTLELNEHTQCARNLYRKTWELIRNRDLRKHKQLPTQYSNIRSVASDVSSALSGRFMFRITAEKSTEGLSTAIIGDATVAVGAAELSSVIYNNLKNAHKKILDSTMQDREKSIAENRKIYLQQNGAQYANIICTDINAEYVALSFTDSGRPLNLDRMLSSIASKIRHEGIENIEWTSPTTMHRFKQWTTNPYAFNRLTAEDISSIAFMANITGSDLSGVTSGMGLYGTQHIISEAGGAIIYTTTPEQKPIFLYILPKKSDAGQKARDVREQIIDGLLVA